MQTYFDSMRHIHHLIIFFIPVFSFGQLNVGGGNPQQIVESTLSGSGVSISNVEYFGNPDALAYFNANTFGMTMNSGLLMTTGSKYYALGPNNIINAGIDQHESGYILMDQMYPGSINRDAARIEFDVIPSGSDLKINYQFASEEYSQYALQGYNDAFCILISGNEYPQVQNFAILPNENSICVSLINSSYNSSYYIDNGDQGTLQAPYGFDNHYIQYNGMTKPLTANIPVTPGLTYHLIMVIAELKDAIFDSGVFIQEGGVTASLGETDLSDVVNLFYNSQNQQATIELKDYQDQLTYIIVDLSGKVMTRAKITETTLVDMSNYSSGMYIIQVEGSNGKISKKVIR